MSIQHFTQQIKQYPNSIEFEQIMNVIGQHYSYTPTAFSNGPALNNAVGSNEGSCKIFAFAKLQGFDKDSTLACFGKFYREEVLLQPDADNHGNIRAFMQHGWDGITFDGEALKEV
jgi:hypothetical protein